MHWIALVIASILLYNRVSRGDKGWTHFIKEDEEWAESHSEQIKRN